MYIGLRGMGGEAALWGLIKRAVVCRLDVGVCSIYLAIYLQPVRGEGRTTAPNPPPRTFRRSEVASDGSCYRRAYGSEFTRAGVMWCETARTRR